VIKKYSPALKPPVKQEKSLYVLYFTSLYHILSVLANETYAGTCYGAWVGGNHWLTLD